MTRVAIVGGGAIGASVALHLVADPAFRGTVTVIERDPGYARAATTLSAASIRSQFSTPENVRLSRFGWEFLAAAPRGLGVDVGLRERGYLILASEAGLEALRANHAVQRAEGAAVALLDRRALAERFPWLSTEGVAAGSLGTAREGWFDAATLLGGLKATATAAGARVAKAEATGLATRAGAIEAVETDAGEVAAEVVVNAAGPWAAAPAAWAGAALPVRPAKRTVFRVRARGAAAVRAESPLIVDPCGVYVRPEGDGFIAGFSPPAGEDPAATDFEPDWGAFEAVVWPALAARAPAFEAIRLGGAWAGWYEMSDHDANGFVGASPGRPELIHAAGFSGHGLQHAPGVGRAVAELIVHGGFRTLDLSALSPARLAEGRRVVERAVI